MKNSKKNQNHVTLIVMGVLETLISGMANVTKKEGVKSQLYLYYESETGVCSCQMVAIGLYQEDSLASEKIEPKVSQESFNNALQTLKKSGWKFTEEINKNEKTIFVLKTSGFTKERKSPEFYKSS